MPGLGTAAVVLAAGTASRFGGQKLLVPLRGHPLVRHTVENVLASGVTDVVVVLGADADGVRAALAGLPVRLVVNPDYRDGMSTSLRCGIRALDPGVAAALVVLGDQPTVSPELMRRVVAAQRDSGKPIAAPVYAGTQGNPVVFARAVFGEIDALEGDRGAREVVQRDAARVVRVHVDGEMPRDVDTREDYEALAG
ncbi:MAG TPA: nucleotidyltransferase family protein [Longimicrobiales bacterium]